MCTVSFIPVKEKIFITSNRDEKSWRKPARLPEQYSMQQTSMVFPKDGDAGGTWITMCDNGNAGVLLNGAFIGHERKENYLRSRGLVFLDTMDTARPLNTFLKADLEGIEPFTFILWQQNSLYECRWDAKQKKHLRSLPAYRPYVWSSSTLYDDDVRKKRELWFAKWLNKYPCPSQKEVLKFHRFAGDGDKSNDLFMNRDGRVFTVSITGIVLESGQSTMHYTDLISDESVEHEIIFNQRRIAV